MDPCWESRRLDLRELIAYELFLTCSWMSLTFSLFPMVSFRCNMLSLLDEFELIEPSCLLSIKGGGRSAGLLGLGSLYPYAPFRRMASWMPRNSLSRSVKSTSMFRIRFILSMASLVSSSASVSGGGASFSNLCSIKATFLLSISC